MEFDNIIFEKQGHIVTLTLNRPDQLNALDTATYDELHQAMLQIESDSEIRVVVLKGSGRVFCAGADLKSMQSCLDKISKTVNFLENCHRTYDALYNLTVPTIAAVHGMALGGGLELVECCDIVIAAETAKIGDQHAARGLVAGGGSTQRLTRQMHFRKALELLLTGDWISAEEAERYGFVNKVVPDEKLGEAVQEMAEKLASRSPMASKIIKMLAKRGAETDLTTALKMEIVGVAQHMFTDDFREGAQSFLEKRAPEFTGS